QLDLCLRRQASALLSQAGISEPVTWEPPSGWAPGIPRPSPDPDAASAGQRIRRLLAIPGQPDLQHAARQLGTTTARLARQVRQLEDVAGTALLRTGPDGRLMLTAYGRLFARDVRPALEAITQTREKDPGHAP
ncbi:MAG TPA: LysR family transcriptional regulator, partial [Streptosporangiaceae bacterium]|nr:LysR family transcriptional regulator [Streptosporangiaceae bacterium]